ncbi:aminopeptidase [Anaerotignum sp.]|uniref:aminopeptidase n=1 Tax=Anaerotignum sp. TaxID=2039241 RepID=UPI0027154CE5|nr:hypothetical protein [Anaerotignum sp.]
MKDLPKAANILLTTCSECKKDEKILFVTDPTSYEVARLVYDAAKDFPNKSLIMMDERNMHGENSTDLVAAAMLEADVIFGATKFSLFHSNARKAAVAKGARFVNMADYSIGMMHAGGLYANFAEAREVCSRIADIEQDAKTVTITSEKGSHFTCSVEGRNPVPQYARSIEKGTSSSPPDVECATCAVEGTGYGVVYIDGSIPHPKLGLIHDEIKITIEASKIVKIEGGEQAKILSEVMESFNDEKVYMVGEIGIGLNPMCELNGRMLEDEGCGGTVHFGCGDNLGFGGTVSCPVHLDLIFTKPTLKIDETVVLNEGNVVV